MLSPQKQKKVEIIKSISQRLDLVNSLVVLNYQYFKSNEFVDLRSTLKDNSAELKVFKNTLFIKTLEQRGDKNLNLFSDLLKGQNIFLFSYQDPLLPTKLFLKFCEENDKNFNPLISVIESSVITDKQNLMKLVNFENKENIFAYIAFILKLPLIKLVITLKQIQK